MAKRHMASACGDEKRARCEPNPAIQWEDVIAISTFAKYVSESLQTTRMRVSFTDDYVYCVSLRDAADERRAVMILKEEAEPDTLHTKQFFVKEWLLATEYLPSTDELEPSEACRVVRDGESGMDALEAVMSTRGDSRNRFCIKHSLGYSSGCRHEPLFRQDDWKLVLRGIDFSVVLDLFIQKLRDTNKNLVATVKNVKPDLSFTVDDMVVTASEWESCGAKDISLTMKASDMIMLHWLLDFDFNPKLFALSMSHSDAPSSSAKKQVFLKFEVTNFFVFICPASAFFV